jgi:hypothetical protein
MITLSLYDEMAQDIERLKVEGLYRWAGALAAGLGRDAAYGCHYGMRSTLESARAQFRQGWRDAEDAIQVHA